MAQFSVLMASYNNGPFVDEAIGSVLAQSFSDWELIIIDDCSQDNSVERIKTYCSDPRIKLYVKDKNEGYVRALIFGLTKVNSEIVGILDSDDALAPEAIEKAHLAHKTRPELGLVLSQRMNCDSTLKPLFATVNTPKHLKEPLLWGRGGTHFNTFKLSAYAKTAGLDARMPAGEDCDLIYKLEEVAPFIRLDEPLYRYRRHTSSVSQAPRRHRVARCYNALAFYRAWQRRRRTRVPILPREMLLAWLISAVRYSHELGDAKQAMTFALRGLRVAPFDGAAYRAVARAAGACLGLSKKERDGDPETAGGAISLRFYPVNLLQSDTGNIEPDRVVCIPLVHNQGHCLFGGDYYVLTDGAYVASFELEIDPYSFAEDPIVVLDVYENLQSNSVLAEREIVSADLEDRSRRFDVEFSAKEGQRVEFRVYWAEQCFLKANGIVLKQKQ